MEDIVWKDRLKTCQGQEAPRIRKITTLYKVCIEKELTQE